MSEQQHEPECIYEPESPMPQPGDPVRPYTKGKPCICGVIRVVRADEARRAADRVEALPWSSGGAKVNRNAAIMAARDGRPRFDASGGE